jgi:hypothetical protein
VSEWKTKIVAGGATVRAYADYAAERIAFHTKVCTARAASDADIRASQAAIEELQRLVSLPETLAREAVASGRAVER